MSCFCSFSTVDICAQACGHVHVPSHNMQQINTSSTKMMLPLTTVQMDSARALCVLLVAIYSLDAQNKPCRATLLLQHEDVLAGAEASFVGHINMC